MEKADLKKIKNEIISPRNNPKGIVKTPQNKNIDFVNRFKDLSGSQKESKAAEKKKKI